MRIGSVKNINAYNKHACINIEDMEIEFMTQRGTALQDRSSRVKIRSEFSRKVELENNDHVIPVVKPTKCAWLSAPT